jgi:hypothetical protein
MISITVRGVIRNGRVEVEDPIPLPDGAEVLIQPVGVESENEADESWDNSPEGIAAWLAWYDSLQPLVFTADELSALDADRQARREWEKAHFDEQTEKLRSMWE